MKKLDIDNYKLNTIIGSKIYIHKKINEGEILYIGQLDNIIEDSYLLLYQISKGYYFFIPNNTYIKCYCYNIMNNVQIDNNCTIYLLTQDEYVNSYIKFKDNDAKLKNEIDNKIICD